MSAMPCCGPRMNAAFDIASARGTVFRDDGRAQRRHRRLQRVGIEQVSVRAPRGDEKIRVVGRRRHRPALHVDDADQSVGDVGILDPDRPERFARRRAQHVLIAARIDESRQAVAAQHVRRDFHGKALGDAAQVDLHTWMREADCVMRRVHNQAAVADERSHRGQLGGRRDVRRLVAESPEPDERADRHVERAVAVRADALRRFNHPQQRIADDDRAAGGLAVDVRELAVAPVIAHEPIDFGHGGKRFIDRGATSSFVAPDGLDLHRGPHQVTILTGIGAAVRGVRRATDHRG